MNGIRISVKHEKSLAQCRCPTCKSFHKRMVFPDDYDRDDRAALMGERPLLVECEECEQKQLDAWKAALGVTRKRRGKRNG